MKSSRILEFLGTSLRSEHSRQSYQGVNLLSCKYFYLTVHCKVYSSKLGGQHLFVLYSKQEIDRLTAKLCFPSTINILKKLIITAVWTNIHGLVSFSIYLHLIFLPTIACKILKWTKNPVYQTGYSNVPNKRACMFIWHIKST